MSSQNPYSAPLTSPIEPVIVAGELGQAEATRREFLKHETSVRSIGVLYYLGAIVMLLASVVGLVSVASGVVGPAELVIFAVFLVLTPLYFLVGRGLRKLDPRVKVPVLILSILGLLSFPVGTLINGYILYLVFSEKGRFVMSPEYREIVRVTPHIKYKSSWVMVVLLVLLVLILAFGVIAYFVGARR